VRRPYERQPRDVARPSAAPKPERRFGAQVSLIPELLNVGLERPVLGEAEASVEDDLVNALPLAGVQSYDERAAARYVLCIRKEVLAMFAHRQTPPRVAL
jgi:hypothetical protein